MQTIVKGTTNPIFDLLNIEKYISKIKVGFISDTSYFRLSVDTLWF